MVTTASEIIANINVYELQKKETFSKTQKNQLADAQILRQKVTKHSSDFSMKCAPSSYHINRKKIHNYLLYAYEPTKLHLNLLY
jgi:hypothetical protein